MDEKGETSTRRIVKLESGRSVVVDVGDFLREDMFAVADGLSREDETEFILKWTDLTREELKTIKWYDFRLVFDKIMKLVNRPLEDPKN